MHTLLIYAAKDVHTDASLPQHLPQVAGIYCVKAFLKAVKQAYSFLCVLLFPLTLSLIMF